MVRRISLQSLQTQFNYRVHGRAEGSGTRTRATLCSKLTQVLSTFILSTLLLTGEAPHVEAVRPRCIYPNLVVNPSFESPSQYPWVDVPSGSTISNWNSASPSEPAHTGSKAARLYGVGKSYTNYTTWLVQFVTIPQDAVWSIFSFYFHIDTAETTTTAKNDTMQVLIRSNSGAPLATLATYSNLDQAPGYRYQSFDVTRFRGQTIQVYFYAEEDYGRPTSFVIDDVALTVNRDLSCP